MKKNTSYELLLPHTVTLGSLSERFDDYYFTFEVAKAKSQGSLYHAQEIRIADVQFYPEENRLELYPLPSQEPLVLGVLKSPSFLQLFKNTFTDSLLSSIQACAEESEIHTSLPKAQYLGFMMELLLENLDPETRKQYKSQVSQLKKRAEKLALELCLKNLHDQYTPMGVDTAKKLEKRHDKYRSTLLQIDWNDWTSLAEESAILFGQFNLSHLVDDLYRSLIKAAKRVHSARDIKPLSKVHKRVGALLFAAKLASVPQRSEILALRETLDQWKCFIVMQDRLLALENPSLKVREAAVQLQRKTEALMDSYRLLAATILEERA